MKGTATNDLVAGLSHTALVNLAFFGCLGEKYGERKCSAESPALYFGGCYTTGPGRVFEESNPLFLL